MTPEEYFGEKLAESVQELYQYAIQLDSEARTTLIIAILDEADKQQRNTVKSALHQIAERISLMEGQNDLCR